MPGSGGLGAGSAAARTASCASRNAQGSAPSAHGPEPAGGPLAPLAGAAPPPQASTAAPRRTQHNSFLASGGALTIAPLLLMSRASGGFARPGGHPAPSGPRPTSGARSRYEQVVLVASLAEVSRAVSATPSRLEKVKLLAAALRELSPGERAA